MQVGRLHIEIVKILETLLKSFYRIVYHSDDSSGTTPFNDFYYFHPLMKITV